MSSAVKAAKVTGIQFSLLSAAEIRQRSVVIVDNESLYERGTANTIPTRGGLMDTRMGPCTRRALCATCSGDWSTCQGHFGHIELDAPVYNFLFTQTLINVLKCVCAHCYGLLANEHDEKVAKLVRTTETRTALLREMVNLCKRSKECPHCTKSVTNWRWAKTGVSLRTRVVHWDWTQSTVGLSG